MKKLSEWAREAQACDLDYGTYRALIESGKTLEEIKTAEHYPRASHAHKEKFW